MRLQSWGCITSGMQADEAYRRWAQGRSGCHRCGGGALAAAAAPLAAACPAHRMPPVCMPQPLSRLQVMPP